MDNKQYKVLFAKEFKTGTSTGKNGNPYTWVIWSATLEGYNGEVTGFDAVNPGDMVTLVTKQSTNKDGRIFNNINYEKVVGGEAPSPANAEGQAQAPVASTAAPAAAPAPAASTGGRDPRVMKFLVLIAKQIGVEDEKIMEVLES